MRLGLSAVGALPGRLLAVSGLLGFFSSPLVEVAQRLLPCWECEQKATICWTAGKGRNGAVSSFQAGAHWGGKGGWGEGELPVQLDTRAVVR